MVRNQPVRPPGTGEWFKWVLDSGPPFGPPGTPLAGLTKEDFTLLDDGKPQPIAVFRAGPATDNKPIALPPGAVSNRQDSRGQPVNNATAVLIDFLNTDFDYTGYERLGMTSFLRSLAQTDSRIALYALGENLHVLHDFADDPQKLMEVAAQLEKSHGNVPAELASALKDYGDLLDLGREEVHGQMTVKALRLIIQHLSGVPGRKNLVWLMDNPLLVPPAVMAMMQRANIVLYPVVVRSVPDIWKEGVARNLAAVTGGRAFFDAKDLTFAVHTAEEDPGSAYVLGYYPAEEMLDGKYHGITVKIQGKAPDKQPLEVHYRPGYLATKTAVPPPAPTREELFKGAINSALIGLTGQAAADAQHPGHYNLSVTVDLHDIHLDSKDGHFTGGFDVSVPKPSTPGAIVTGTIKLDFTDKQLAPALENGIPFDLSRVEPLSGELRVVVSDRATGVAGSLRIPVPKETP